MTFLRRNIEAKLNDLLEYFPVVIILGVRQCGKTTLANMLTPDWKYVDLERGWDLAFITRDIDFFFKEYPHSVIIDETQRYPTLFQELRGVIDRDRKRKNRFLLTGSSSLELVKNVSESLAGRVALVELETLALNEIYGRKLPEFLNVFLNPIDRTTIQQLRTLKPEISHDQLMHAFLKGGYPEPILENDDQFYQFWMDNYINTYIQRDIRTLFPRLDLIKYQRFVTMLSALSGTIINRSQVGRSLDISEKAIRDYLQIAEGGYIWRNVPSYEKSKSKSVVKMPKGYLRDSGLAHFVQGIATREQLLNYPHVGASFESFVCEELLKGLHALPISGWSCHYYRTRNGAKIDLIIDGPFGTLPIEIKIGSTVKKRHLQPLKNFMAKNNIPLGILINNADSVQVVADNIVQIPATLL
ncbi:MAG: ATP-binding protein [Deltaproteobacteria bacterium]|nr:ATP-binding protein [Deltaproteobacteria bacterium]